MFLFMLYVCELFSSYFTRFTSIIWFMNRLSSTESKKQGKRHLVLQYLLHYAAFFLALTQNEAFFLFEFNEVKVENPFQCLNYLQRNNALVFERAFILKAAAEECLAQFLFNVGPSYKCRHASQRRMGNLHYCQLLSHRICFFLSESFWKSSQRVFGAH